MKLDVFGTKETVLNRLVSVIVRASTYLCGT